MLYPPRDWAWNQIGGKPLHYAFDPARASIGNVGERGKKKNQDSTKGSGTQQEEADSRGPGKGEILQDPQPACRWSLLNRKLSVAWWHQEQGSYSGEENKLERLLKGSSVLLTHTILVLNLSSEILFNSNENKCLCLGPRRKGAVWPRRKQECRENGDIYLLSGSRLIHLVIIPAQLHLCICTTC